ncbi:lytic transglycosylase domain-containing protein [Jiangella asiatica]|uniref:lytic transglycosylase domain-containing protein n=1 Tax=Jiangella asiatica TaxID=2530372 RepID=UPI00193E62F0|nr:lytic murein transglycosylase [Jiangella asiatica]
MPGPAELVSSSEYPDDEGSDTFANRGDSIVGGSFDGQASVTVVVDDQSTASGFVVGSPATNPLGSPTLAGGLGIPSLVLQAYQSAASRMSLENPACGIRWEILAGIGKIESNHANGGQVAATGEVQPRIIGPALDGNGFASIGDSDGGRWDGDTAWDRAVGPMQFIPGTWKAFGADGNGDGVVDPHNLFDATLAAAGYLCAGGHDLSTEAGLRAALYRYNPSTAYVDRVMSWIEAYDSGTGFPTPTPGPGPAGAPLPPPSTDAPNPSGSPTPTPTTPPPRRCCTCTGGRGSPCAPTSPTTTSPRPAGRWAPSWPRSARPHRQDPDDH